MTGTWQEHLRITNHTVDPVEVAVGIEVAADFAYIFDVKHGRHPAGVEGRLVEGGVRFDSSEAGGAVLLRMTPVPEDVTDGRLTWDLSLPAQASWHVDLSLEVEPSSTREEVPVTPPAPPGRRAAGSLARPRVTCSDTRFERLIERSIVDLDSLVVHDREDRYFAAGTPWFLTLFGRDSLWSAMMALPLGVEMAGETLRVLARKQGTRHDAVTEEAPGKILHEVRFGPQVDRGDLPPRYFGSIDATPLFVMALERSWRWGLDQESVTELLPRAERALAWMRDDGDPDGTGFLRYVAVGERRLANQGWKDSDDGICFADGTLADAPIALCEVQGYAHRAAVAGAALLDAHGRPGGDEWRAWASALRARFQEAFWVEDADGGFPALAIDGTGRQVDAVTSNAAHLLGTGILQPAQEARVAARLAAPDMDSGWGLRTLSSDSPRFNPLSYHGGSVWPHRTRHRAGRAGPGRRREDRQPPAARSGRRRRPPRLPPPGTVRRRAAHRRLRPPALPERVQPAGLGRRGSPARAASHLRHRAGRAGRGAPPASDGSASLPPAHRREHAPGRRKTEPRPRGRRAPGAGVAGAPRGHRACPALTSRTVDGDVARGQ